MQLWARGDPEALGNRPDDLEHGFGTFMVMLATRPEGIAALEPSGIERLGIISQSVGLINISILCKEAIMSLPLTSSFGDSNRCLLFLRYLMNISLA